MIQKNQRDSSKNHSRVEIICRITRQFVEPSYALKKNPAFGDLGKWQVRGGPVFVYTPSPRTGRSYL